MTASAFCFKPRQVARLGLTALLCMLLCMMLLPSHAAPEAWQLKDMAGKTHRAAQYHGKWLLVNYWAPWCPPCLEEMPELVAFYDAHPKQVMVLGVAVRYESVQSVRDFAEDMLISYPVILGDSQKDQLQSAEVLPTTYIYKPDGSLLQIKRGAVSKQSLEKLLQLTKP